MHPIPIPLVMVYVLDWVHGKMKVPLDSFHLTSILYVEGFFFVVFVCQFVFVVVVDLFIYLFLAKASLTK